jgi:hypothetical protein
VKEILALDWPEIFEGRCLNIRTPTVRFKFRDIEGMSSSVVLNIKRGMVGKKLEQI